MFWKSGSQHSSMGSTSSSSREASTFSSSDSANSNVRVSSLALWSFSLCSPRHKPLSSVSNPLSWLATPISYMPIKPILTASVLIYVTSSICSDALLIYRCYVIWDSNIYVIGPSVILLISATVSGYMRSITIFQIISLTTGISVTLLTLARVVWS
ncbi:hypothetical protein C8R43DRAFT_1238849, partial [Mycena crocata]